MSDTLVPDAFDMNTEIIQDQFEASAEPVSEIVQ